MVKLKNKVKGLTLVEVLVAITLIATVISFFFLSVENINKTFNVDLKTYALTVVDSCLQDMDSSYYSDETIDYPSFKIRKLVGEYNHNPELFTVSISAYSNDGKLLINKQRILFYKP
jgi:prepilin-type N-terminal cleavage/methylation domain-containing protein